MLRAVGGTCLTESGICEQEGLTSGKERFLYLLEHFFPLENSLALEHVMYKSAVK